MAIHYVTIKGRIKDGVLEAKVPANMQDGEVEVKLSLEAAEENGNQDFVENGLTLGEILDSGLVGIGATADMDIPEDDSLQFVAELRRKEEERRGNWTHS
jgi:hypothetical protein